MENFKSDPANGYTFTASEFTGVAGKVVTIVDRYGNTIHELAHAEFLERFDVKSVADFNKVHGAS